MPTHTLSSLSSQDAEGQVHLRHVLGAPIRIHAEPGDLILLCVQRPNAAIELDSPTAIVRVGLHSFCNTQDPINDWRLKVKS